ncbi:MAG: hypothetical protein ABI261_01120 [Ginsengibacter sp.]
MKTFIFLSLNFLLFCNGENAQMQANSSVSPVVQKSAEKGLFESDEILNITLKGNVRQLLNDRTDKPAYYPFTLTYSNGDSSDITLPIKIKTRGHFRRQQGNCTYPPLLLDFPKSDSQTTSFFPAQTSLKLVVPCRGEDYIIHEWLVYKLYNLITPLSFRARLVKVTLEDTRNKKMPSPFYGIILEQEHQMAKRNNDTILKEKIRPQQTMQEPFLKMAVFEYLIGNTDWSVEFQQNIKLVAPDSKSVPVAVPYDFDQAGIVDAPYAKPAEELKMRSVRERRYRGYCVKDMELFDSTIAVYNSLKNEIYKTYTGCSLLNSKYIKETIKFLDDFYSTINNPKALKKEFEYPCDPNGTGNVIIKGLKED